MKKERKKGAREGEREIGKGSGGSRHISSPRYVFFFHCNAYFFYTNICLIIEYSYTWQHPPQKGVTYFNERGAHLEPGYVFFYTTISI